jgi:hypothetical protein
MTESKYIMAIISIPIEITANGDQITHTDLYKVDFTVIDYLPPASTPLVEINVAELFSQIADKPSDNLAFRNDVEDLLSDSESFNDEPSDIDDSVSDITDNAEYPNYVSDIESEPENEDLDDGFAIQNEHTSIPDMDDNVSCTFYESPEDEREPKQENEKEIAKRRTFPKSKTIRRTHTHISNRKRFSRRVNERMIYIPQHIIRALNL